ncbi:hypothetical protein GCM10009127_19060 [Alteraurantiacibacter aestuarii]|uniref:hypothetical protein n=1 Tax=Alteraurantiacibacter aestuarii TaxID=650004 RepID=UPI0031E22C68
MNKLLLSASLGLICIGSAAMAQSDRDDRGDQRDQAATQSQANAQQQAEEEAEVDPRQAEVVCRSTPVLGSRTRVNRVCMTRAEWADASRRTGEGVADMQRNAAGGLQCGNDPAGGC